MVLNNVSRPSEKNIYDIYISEIASFLYDSKDITYEDLKNYDKT